MFNPYPEPYLYPSFVLYADILGFTEMVRSPDAARYLKEIRQALEIAKHHVLEDKPDQPFRVSAFSDNIVLGWPLEDGDRTLSTIEPVIGSILFQAAIFQLEMAVRGFFVRGALT